MAKNGVINKEELYKKVSKKTGIPEDIVKEAVHSQWSYTRKIMAEGNFIEDGEVLEDMSDANIRLPYFGVFKVKPQRVKKINE